MENAEWVCDKYANTSFGTDMVMVCMEKDGTEGMKKNVAVDRLKDILQREIYHHYSAVYENRVCMLFDRGTVSDELWERIRKDLVKHAETYGLMAGISYRFSEQKYIPLAYQQAIYALKWSDGASQKKITFFDDCMLDCLVEQCTVTFPAEFFRHPALEKLEQYDREYHTNYLGTLEIYLTNFCSMKATAKALDIHYNTMKYRISMIENIIDESVRENNKLKKQLYFSMLFQKI
jgi:sugar diacid utilization regulator